MRVVIDTNVLISSALKASSWPGFVVQWIALHGRLLKSVAVEDELFEVLRRPRIAKVAASIQVSALVRLFAGAEMVTITQTLAIWFQLNRYRHRCYGVIVRGSSWACSDGVTFS